MFDADGNYCGAKYTLHYEGFLFDGDSIGWNHQDYDRWEDIHGVFSFYAHYVEEGQMDMYITDNEYGVTLSYSPSLHEWEWC